MKSFKFTKCWALALLVLGLGSLNGYADGDADSGIVSEEIAAAFGAIAIQDQGRIKPLDTFARSQLLTYQGKSTYDGGSAMSWFMTLLLDPEKAYDQRIFKLRTDEVVESMSVPVNEDDHTYSFKEIGDGLNRISADLQKINEKQPDDRSRVEKQLLELFYKTGQYLDVSRSLTGVVADIDVGHDGLLEELGLEPGKKVSYLEIIEKKDLVGEKLIAWSKLPDDEKQTMRGLALSNMARALQAKMRDQASRSFRVIAPDAAHQSEDWSPAWAMLDGRTLSDWERSRLDGLKTSVELALAGDAEALKAHVTQMNEEARLGWRIDMEVSYNSADLFYRSLYLYVLSCLLLWFSFIGFSKWLSRLSFASLAVATLLQVVGITMRSVMMNRPPVTTLYESIIFVCAVATLGAVVLEWFWRKGFALFIGGVTGVVLTFVGLRYASEGDTMGMLVAVLDDNFWLATHVLTINIGYSAAFLAGLVAHVYLVLRCGGDEWQKMSKGVFSVSLSVSFVALFFVVIGTILGGIWADQSWGRFWGWDPKENGALLIALWLLIVLHGRIAGYLKPMEYAAGLGLVNITVALAWFGVNLLSVGLHNYGFDDGVATGLFAYCALEVLFTGVVYIIAWNKAKTLKAA